MPTKDGFDPTEPLPRFLTRACSSEVDTGSRQENALIRNERAEQDIGYALDEAAPRSGVLKAGILTAAATAIGIAVLAAGDPAPLLAWVSASLVGNSSQSTTAIQSAADQVLPPAATDAAARNEIAASEQAGVHQTESRELPSETLKHFQAWAAQREAQAQARSEPSQPVQDLPAPVAQDAPAEVAPAQDAAAQDAPAQVAAASAAENAKVSPGRLAQKRRQVRSFRSARAEMRTQYLRKQARRAERARAERPPVQDVRAQETSAQNAPPLPYFFGLFNQTQ